MQTIAMIPETMIFAKGAVFLITVTLFPILRTMVSGPDSMISVSGTIVRDREAIVGDPKTIFLDGH